MATTRLIPLHTGKERKTGQAIRGTIEYVMNPGKTERGEFITSYACDHRTADLEFMLSKREYIAKTGRIRGKDDVIAYHLRQSFVPEEITPQEANRLGQELARRFTHGEHAFIVATHTDRKHIHNHIIFHSVNLECDRKFKNFWGSSQALRRLNDTICIENGYSIVEQPKGHGKSYNKWLGDRAKPGTRDILRAMLDEALTQKPASLDDLFSLLQNAGCKVKRGKQISLRGPEQKRFCRLDTLGNGYDEVSLLAVLSGERQHQPSRKASSVPAAKVNLLVDIQAKLHAGKGPGYARWAKVFNLKQMAQTLNYLSEMGLTDYDELAAKTQDATHRCSELDAKIKVAEKRLGEIAILKTHIINYIKTRETYAAYRQSGYSKRFLTEHESEILLHRAAKKAFDDLGVKKLPTVKKLQSEYAEILTEKKKDYAEYRALRTEIRQLLTAKANVDLILGHDERHPDDARCMPDQQR
ncbi:MAG: relaxase/mobilization nuclease domain-containing protein [Clostridia bacterium]|nr:relaxase/mobilization nuclease domain-containing protein [Clostridia bacterium]